MITPRLANVSPKVPMIVAPSRAAEKFCFGSRVLCLGLNAKHETLDSKVPLACACSMHKESYSIRPSQFEPVRHRFDRIFHPWLVYALESRGAMMAATFRGYLDTLKKNNELTVISKATDLRDLA